MTKKLAGSPKESGVSVQSEARELLWGAVPPRLGDNRKSWIAYAAHVLGWRPRRVRAIWNCEARVIRVEEMRALQERYTALERREAERKAINELRTANRVAWASPAVVCGDAGQRGDGDRPVVGVDPSTSSTGSRPQSSD